MVFKSSALALSVIEDDLQSVLYLVKKRLARLLHRSDRRNPSLLMFSNEAYSVKSGISNELFPIERDDNPTYQFAKVPNESTVVDRSEGLSIANAVSGLERFSFFMKFLAPPLLSPDTPGGEKSIMRGRRNFSALGCALCHTPALQTTSGNMIAALSKVAVNLFSDSAVHKMGTQLADDIVQGSAAGDEFGTAPVSESFSFIRGEPETSCRPFRLMRVSEIPDTRPPRRTR